MIIKSFTFNDFGEHCYVLSNDSNEAIVIDPGCCYQQERDEFANYIKTEGLQIKRVINTHLHVDHILGNRFIQDTYGIGAESSVEDEPLLENMLLYAKMFGLVGQSFSEADFYTTLEAQPLVSNLKEGDIVAIKDIQLQVIHIPGHTLGHLAFYNPLEHCVFVGDILFKGSIGRTDLAGQDPQKMQELLVSGINRKLLVLPNDTIVFPGHGPTTTIEIEKNTNCYL